MKEIPYNVMTCVVDDIKLLTEYLDIGFQDKRKARKSHLKKVANLRVPYNAEPNYEYPILRNTGFKIELEEIPEGMGVYYTPKLFISHPELPSREKFKYSININYDDYGKVLHLISSSRGMVRGVLNGTYCYDPNINFFRLENGDLDKEIELGKILSGSWTKLIPGHEYYIEIGPAALDITNVIYLGPVSNVKFFDEYRGKYKYNRNIVDELSLNREWLNLVKGGALLFRDLNPHPTSSCPYFICTKQNIKGVDMGNRGETMSETEFEDLCTRESWFCGISDTEKEKKYLIKTLSDYVKSNGGVLSSSNLYDDPWKIQPFKFSLYNPETLFNLIESKIKTVTSISFREMTCFVRLFANRDVLGFSDDDIKDVLKGVFEAL